MKIERGECQNGHFLIRFVWNAPGVFWAETRTHLAFPTLWCFGVAPHVLVTPNVLFSSVFLPHVLWWLPRCLSSCLFAPCRLAYSLTLHTLTLLACSHLYWLCTCSYCICFAMSVEKMSEGSWGSDTGNPVHHVSILLWRQQLQDGLQWWMPNSTSQMWKLSPPNSIMCCPPFPLTRLLTRVAQNFPILENCGWGGFSHYLDHFEFSGGKINEIEKCLGVANRNWNLGLYEKSAKIRLFLPLDKKSWSWSLRNPKSWLEQLFSFLLMPSSIVYFP